MIQLLPARNSSLIPFKFKRYFESKNNQIRIFGQCEVTGKNFEMLASTEGFFVYLQGFKSITEALSANTEKERGFVLNGISPEGQDIKQSADLS